MNAPANLSQYKALLEKLAELEHQQWMEWAKNLMDREPLLSPGRVSRWNALMVPYAELGENQKDQDRKWARKVLKEVLVPEMMDFGTKMGEELARLLSEPGHYE